MSNYSSEELEVAIYGLKHLGMLLTSMVVVAVIGLLMSNVKGVFLFLLFFIPLRIFAGGLHLPSLLMCAVASSLLIVFVAYILNTTDSTFVYEKICRIMILTESFIIVILAPVDTKNKLLFNEEKKRYKNISIIVTVIEGIIFFISHDNAFIKMIIFLTFTIELFYLITQKIVNYTRGKQHCTK